MRMMKRLAVCVLAAAMSLTMLTACGDDTPSAPETPSNPGTSQGEEKKDDEKKDPPAESKPEDKKDEEVADGSTIELKKSRTYKWLLEYGSAKKVYIKIEPVKPASQDVVCEESVTDGQKSYTKMTHKNGKTDEQFTELVSGKTKNVYRLYSNQKIAIMTSYSMNAADLNQNVLPDSYNYTVKKTTHVINAIPYYTEVLTIEDKTTKKTETQMFCYDNTGSLAYLVSSPDTAGEQIVRIQCSKVIPDSAILSIPNDWSVYTVTGASDNDITVKDQNGRELTTEEVSALFNKLA